MARNPEYLKGIEAHRRDDADRLGFQGSIALHPVGKYFAPDADL
jgi:hypothetical protein